MFNLISSYSAKDIKEHSVSYAPIMQLDTVIVLVFFSYTTFSITKLHSIQLI
jgi:hypothetical protein